MGRKPSFVMYKEGKPVERAGLTIVEHRVKGLTVKDTLYLIEYHCCGRPKELSHLQIYQRALANRQRCNGCREQSGGKLLGDRARAGLDPLPMQPFTEPPMWPVPPSVNLETSE